MRMKTSNLFRMVSTAGMAVFLASFHDSSSLPGAVAVAAAAAAQQEELDRTSIILDGEQNQEDVLNRHHQVITIHQHHVDNHNADGADDQVLIAMVEKEGEEDHHHDHTSEEKTNTTDRMPNGGNDMEEERSTSVLDNSFAVSLNEKHHDQEDTSMMMRGGKEPPSPPRQSSLRAHHHDYHYYNDTDHHVEYHEEEEQQRTSIIVGEGVDSNNRGDGDEKEEVVENKMNEVASMLSMSDNAADEDYDTYDTERKKMTNDHVELVSPDDELKKSHRSLSLGHGMTFKESKIGTNSNGQMFISESKKTITLKAKTPGNIGRNSDSLFFAYRKVTEDSYLYGDFEVSVHVDSLEGSPRQWAQYGLMIRPSLDADSEFYSALFTGSIGVWSWWRPGKRWWFRKHNNMNKGSWTKYKKEIGRAHV